MMFSRSCHSTRANFAVYVLATRRGFASKPTHQLNINNGLKKKEEGAHFGELLDHPVTTFQGIGPKNSHHFSELGISTIGKLSEYKYFHLARSLVTLATLEEAGGRLEGSVMNVNKGLDKDFEHLALSEIIQQPLHALQGITPATAEIFSSLGVKTIEDLASFKYCVWADAMRVASQYEERK